MKRRSHPRTSHSLPPWDNEGMASLHSGSAVALRPCNLSPRCLCRQPPLVDRKDRPHACPSPTAKDGLVYVPNVRFTILSPARITAIPSRSAYSISAGPPICSSVSPRTHNVYPPWRRLRPHQRLRVPLRELSRHLPQGRPCSEARHRPLQGRP